MQGYWSPEVDWEPENLSGPPHVNDVCCDQNVFQVLLDSCPAVEETPAVVEEGGAAVFRGHLQEEEEEI